jgi:hypothetical protein
VKRTARSWSTRRAVTDFSGRYRHVSFLDRDFLSRMSYCAFPHSPCYNHSKQSKEESVSRHTIAGMSLVRPEMGGLDV